MQTQIATLHRYCVVIKTVKSSWCDLYVGRCDAIKQVQFMVWLAKVEIWHCSKFFRHRASKEWNS